jgi:hypothetical protein
MVWIHGGALVSGESNDYDPAALVADGVTVVTINWLWHKDRDAVTYSDGKSGSW